MSGEEKQFRALHHEPWSEDIDRLERRVDELQKVIEHQKDVLADVRRWQAFCYGVAATIGLFLGVVLWVFDKWATRQ